MKVITFNLRNFTDDHWAERFPLICNDIVEYGADILAFQEVRGYIDARGPNMAQQLQDCLNAKGHSYPYLIVQEAMLYEGLGVWEGLAIMSKQPIVRWGYEKLNGVNNYDPNKRIMLWAYFNPGNGLFYISNNHFSYDRSLGLENAEQVISYLNNGSFEYPGLLVGDLNSTPIEAPATYIKENGWTDIWEQEHPGENGFTVKPGDPRKRIDYQWKNTYFSQDVSDIELVFTNKDLETGLYPSDHYGVMVTF